MAGKLGKFQMTSFESWGGLTKENHLGSIYKLAPQKASDLMVQLLAYRYGKTLNTYLSQFPTKMFDDDTEYTWQVIGGNRKNVPLVEARTLDGSVIDGTEGMIGARVEPFYLVFPEQLFFDGDYIVGELNEVYQFRILGDPRIEGTNYVFRVELAGGNTAGVPATRLLAGERFSREAAFVEKELSRKVSDITFSAPVTMRNEFSTIRLQHKVPGSMLNKKLACGIPIIEETAGGKLTHTVTDMWMHNVEFELERQFDEMRNNAMLWGRSNRTADGEYLNIGKSGNAIKTGAGLVEQMSYGNQMYYNDPHQVMDLILSALYEISAGKLDYGDRTFVINTGERGALLFNKAAKDTTSGWMPLVSTANPAYYQKANADFAPGNAISVNDYQITEWIAPMGVHVKINVVPFYDDPVRHKLQWNGGPAYSSRFDILYIGSTEQPNIFKCGVKNQSDFRGYQWGLRNPFTGQLGNDQMSFDEDSAVFHRMAVFGVCVLDAQRTMSIIPAVLAA